MENIPNLEESTNDISMIIVEDKDSTFDSLFSLMVDSDDEDDDGMILLDLKQNLHDYFNKETMTEVIEVEEKQSN